MKSDKSYTKITSEIILFTDSNLTNVLSRLFLNLFGRTVV